jgi:flagellar biosynthetic protein FliO
MLNLTIKVSRLVIFATLLVAACCVYAADTETVDAQPEEKVSEEESMAALREILGGGAEESGEVAELLEEHNEAAIPDSSGFGVLARLVMSLLVVVAAIYFVGLVAKKFFTRSRPKGGKDALIQVIDRAYLDSKKSIYLVKVVDRLLVVGTGNNDVRLLSTLKDQSVVDSIKTTDFSYHLKDFFGGFNRIGEHVETETEAEAGK